MSDNTSIRFRADQQSSLAALEKNSGLKPAALVRLAIDEALPLLHKKFPPRSASEKFPPPAPARAKRGGR